MSYASRAALLAAITTILIAVFSATGFAHDYKIGDLVIGHPWTRATPPSAKVAGGYLTITNKGSVSDRLVSASFSGSASTEVHEMTHAPGGMKMRELPEGLIIKPGEMLTLRPGSYHLMFINLSAGLKQGENAKGVIVFEKAGRIEVDFKIESIGHRPQDAPAHHQH